MDEAAKEVDELMKDQWAHLAEKPREFTEKSTKANSAEVVENIKLFLDKERVRLSHGQ